MESSKKARRKAGRKARRLAKRQEKKSGIPLDAELWGKLQDHIPLQTVYEKLSPADLFRLRLVCKDWNHGALQRLLPKPSFLTIIAGHTSRCGDFQYLNGIVTYDVVSRQFGFKRHRIRLIPENDSPPFETEGLILCHSPKIPMERGVFNAHTQTWHVIPPPPPPLQECKSLSICGLMVDTSLKPYTFKLIEGNLDFNTRIYDSKTRSWNTTSSRLLQVAEEIDFGSGIDQYSCICNNGHVYISVGILSERGFMILKYSMEDDMWTTLKFPEVKWEDENSPAPENSLGVWEGRILTVRESCEESRVTVWELVDSETQTWEEYAHTTKKQYGWLLNCDFASNGPCIYEEMCLRSFFRDGYLLVAMWRWDSGRADALIMLNLATKKWQKVRLPMGTVATVKQKLLYNDVLSDSDEEGVEDEVDNEAAGEDF